MSKPTVPVIDTNEKINKALEIAWRFSQIDGAHHKAWTIDQIVRALCGNEETYRLWIGEYTKPFLNHGELDYYSWDEGVTP